MVNKLISDLGAAAYIMMHKFKVLGKKGRAFYFEVNDEDAEQFDSLYQDYLTSEFHRFDSCIMSLKKLGEIQSDRN